MQVLHHGFLLLLHCLTVPNRIGFWLRRLQSKIYSACSAPSMTFLAFFPTETPCESGFCGLNEAPNPAFPPHLSTASFEIGGDVDRKRRRLVRKASRTETHVSLIVLRVLEGERAFVLNRPGPLPTLEPACATVSSPPGRRTQLCRATGRPALVRRRDRVPSGRIVRDRAAMSAMANAVPIVAMAWLARGVLRRCVSVRGSPAACSSRAATSFRRNAAAGGRVVNRARARRLPDTARRGHREPGRRHGDRIHRQGRPQILPSRRLPRHRRRHLRPLVRAGGCGVWQSRGGDQGCGVRGEHSPPRAASRR